MVLAFVIGLVFGSFLNVVIYRLKNDRNIISGRSFCPKCKTQLKWPDLIPIFGFVWLYGHCRYCRKKISWQYPIVEILSGFIWVGVFYKVFGFQPPFVPPLIKGGLGGFLNFIYYVFILSSLLIIAVYDFKWRIIPDKIIYPAIVAVLIFNLLEILKYQNIAIFLWPLFTASFAFLFFFLIYFFSKGRAMGLGDGKLAFLIGLFLNPLLAVLAFTLAFILGAVFGIILIGLGKKTFKSQIAFGPFLALGVFLVIFFSDFIIKFINF